ncbi:class I SAM-dependent methyltransferase, partial [Campylobacter jejuni]|nr:class I SAM-dependent methyltransferase [Campylobacter jejuni]
AYEYLPNSIEGFLSKEEFIAELKQVGFEMLEFKSFSFGVSSMFIAKKV